MADMVSFSRLRRSVTKSETHAYGVVSHGSYCLESQGKRYLFQQSQGKSGNLENFGRKVWESQGKVFTKYFSF